MYFQAFKKINLKICFSATLIEIEDFHQKYKNKKTKQWLGVEKLTAKIENLVFLLKKNKLKTIIKIGLYQISYFLDNYLSKKTFFNSDLHIPENILDPK